MKSYFIISMMFRGQKYYYAPDDKAKSTWLMHNDDAKTFSSKDEIQKEISDNFAKFEKHKFVTVETILTTK